MDMDIPMKTTFHIDDTVMVQLKREANRQGRTMSDLVETALRNFLREQRRPSILDPLPGFHSGGTLVDVANRGALPPFRVEPCKLGGPATGLSYDDVGALLDEIEGPRRR